MPLEVGKSKEAFSNNVAAEVEAGKPQEQAVAIAYSKRGDASDEQRKEFEDLKKKLKGLQDRGRGHGGSLDAREIKKKLDHLKAVGANRPDSLLKVADAVTSLCDRFDSMLVRQRSGFKTRHDASGNEKRVEAKIEKVKAAIAAGGMTSQKATETNRELRLLKEELENLRKK